MWQRFMTPTQLIKEFQILGAQGCPKKDTYSVDRHLSGEACAPSLDVFWVSACKWMQLNPARELAFPEISDVLIRFT